MSVGGSAPRRWHRVARSSGGHTQSKARGVPPRKTRGGDCVGHSLWTTWGGFTVHRGSAGRNWSSTRGRDQSLVGRRRLPASGRRRGGMAPLLAACVLEKRGRKGRLEEPERRRWECDPVPSAHAHAQGRRGRPDGSFPCRTGRSTWSTSACSSGRRPTSSGRWCPRPGLEGRSHADPGGAELRPGGSRRRRGDSGECGARQVQGAGEPSSTSSPACLPAASGGAAAEPEGREDRR